MILSTQSGHFLIRFVNTVSPLRWQEICVDEQTVPVNGTLNVKNHIKGKPCQRGVKLFVLYGKSGIAYDFIIYQGSRTEQSMPKETTEDEI
jgi:hypothetical protein